MNISDIIMNEILNSISEEGSATFIRNEVAARLGCVPSQINYVITSRFTPEKGYIVRSRRGGGGSVTITRINLSPGELLMHTVNSVGDSIDEKSARIILENLAYNGSLNERAGKVIYAAICDISLREVQPDRRDRLRATILKNTLLSYINQEE